MGSSLSSGIFGEPEPSVSVSQLWIYPLKSARGIRVDSARVGPLGFDHDRVFMLVEELPSKADPQKTQWYVMTLRKWPRVRFLNVSAECTRWVCLEHQSSIEMAS
jgi:uncharacterized protein YcbX